MVLVKRITGPLKRTLLLLIRFKIEELVGEFFVVAEE